MKKIPHLISALLLASLGQAAHAASESPVYLANQNPFVQIYGLPKSEAGFITPKGKLDAMFLYYVSNNAYSDDPGNGEKMTWDGETSQFTMKLRYGLFERLEVGVDVPYVQQSGGYWDSVIRNFHSLVGFPNDRQEEFDKNQIDYNVSGKSSYRMTDDHSGLGDIRFTAALPILIESERSRRALAVRSVLKLPTGDSDYLLGSGGTDISAGLAYTDKELLAVINTVLTANLGAVYMSDSDVLSEMQLNVAGYGGISADWLALRWLEVKLQLDMHSAMYDTELVQLGSSLQLLAGATIHVPGDVLIDFGISEQLVTDATPDVGFYLMVGHTF
ncbi:DUF3187 family protein [Pontiellaceae bacterium B12219]|nr:DUF3187 family protein [Pontiellaceae bacterium B12219]